MQAGAKRGPGRPPTGIRPELRERAEPDLVAYCQEQQRLNKGFLAGLVEQHRLQNSRGASAITTGKVGEDGLLEQGGANG